MYCLLRLCQRGCSMPETVGDVVHGPVGDFVETLVGAATTERAKVCQIRTQLYIVKVIDIERGGQQCAAAVPGNMQVAVLAAQIMAQPVYILRTQVASHECDTGDVGMALGNQFVEDIGGKGFTTVGP